MMVLREEFFPLMEEVKNSVGVMSKAANGNTLHTSIALTYQVLLELHNLFILIVKLSFLPHYFLRTVGL